MAAPRRLAARIGGLGLPDDASALVRRTLLWAGRVTGRIPADLAAELRFRSLRRYLLLNVVLERTAELAYRRLAEVATAVGDEDEAATFGRIAADEASHGLGYPVYVYLGGRGRRFTPRMDADAFPPIGPVTPLTRATRWRAQVPFGLRPPD